MGRRAFFFQIRCSPRGPLALTGDETQFLLPDVFAGKNYVRNYG
jgi:hypothetical protein